MKNILRLARSKAVWGAIFGAGAWLASQPKLGVLEVITALGSVLGVAGLRDGALKSASPDSIDGAKLSTDGKIR